MISMSVAPRLIRIAHFAATTRSLVDDSQIDGTYRDGQEQGAEKMINADRPMGWISICC